MNSTACLDASLGTWLNIRSTKDHTYHGDTPTQRPLAIDLFCGLFGWAEGLVEGGFEVIGFDLEDMCAQFAQPRPEHVQLVLQDVLTLHGSQFRHAALIVASPPCQFFSYTAMPWSRAKALAADVRADPARLEKELALFKACFRIQREACEASGKYIPMVVENVRGAIPWVGRSRWNFGSFHLWGDVPALMPFANTRFHKIEFPHLWLRDPKKAGGKYAPAYTIKHGGDWFNSSEPCIARLTGSKSPARKAASALIAKIPLPLSSHIAAIYGGRGGVGQAALVALAGTPTHDD